MKLSTFQKRVRGYLEKADIQINGERPWDIRVYDPQLYPSILTKGSLGLGESYMQTWWDCPRLDEFFCRILSAGIEESVRTWRSAVDYARATIYNFQKSTRAFEIGERHYDTGNDLFKSMLDKYMVYSCAYWKDACTLDEAQEAKLDLICRKLHLEPGMKVLDVGCGWGGAACFAAERYGAEVTGVTVSKEQAEYGREMAEGLPVEIRLQDYRELSGKYDRIVSVGMFEHVGYKNYETYMRVICSLLKDDGLFLLQTIGRNRAAKNTDPWIEKYIFPNSMLPSPGQTSSAVEKYFVLEDWQNLGTDYEKTLLEWHRNFTESWEDLKEKYDEQFYRMWEYYLLSCAGAFRARKNQLWQIVLSSKGVPGRYEAIR